MWHYVARRIVYAVPIAIGVTVFCFALVFLAPGNPVQMLLPADASQEVVDLIMKTYGFDRPLPVQYWTWLTRAVTVIWASPSSPTGRSSTRCSGPSATRCSSLWAR